MLGKTLKAILFDWGNTLVTFTDPVDEADETYLDLACFRAALRDYDHPGTLCWPTLRETYLAVWRQQLECVAQTGLECSLYERVATAFTRTGHPAEPGDLMVRNIVNNLCKRLLDHIKPAPQVNTVITALAREFPIGVVSNFPHAMVVRQSLIRFGLRGYFQFMIISAEVGVAKPHPALFRRALYLMGMNPEDVLFVGDDPYIDIWGAQRVGLRTALVGNHHADMQSTDPDFILSSLAELPALMQAYGDPLYRHFCRPTPSIRS